MSNKPIIIHRPDSRVVQTTNGDYVKTPATEDETWIEDDYHCPCCSTTPIYRQSGDGDLYVGPTYICTACASSFTLQDNGITDLSKQRAVLIKEAINA